MKIVVLKLEIHEEKIKQKAMKAVSGLSGVESVKMDMKDKKLTLIGVVDAVRVVAKLRKFCHAEIVSVEEKKNEPKKEEPKKKEDDKKDSTKENVIDPFMFYGTHAYYYNHQMRPQYYPYYGAVTVEENPNTCVII